MHLHQFLNTYSAGRVLDVATGRGGFASEFVQHVKEFDELIGIDSNERNAESFKLAFTNQPHISFRCMDAARLDFPDASFDTVCIANSLHHMEQPLRVLAEMCRVLKPGGRIITVEMYSDNQRETQLTHVLLHHWWAAVDSAGGVSHRETYTRAALVALLEQTGLAWQFSDECDLESDPLDSDGIRQLEGIIDQYNQRAQGLPGADALIQRGEALRSRLREVGFHGATALIGIGQHIISPDKR